jgi:hypothetical protein
VRELQGETLSRSTIIEASYVQAAGAGRS